MSAEYQHLADQFGTPLYVYDLDRIAAARRDLFAALPERFTLFFALKANPHPEVARALREGGERACRAEISSTGELNAALTAGFAGADCLYTGPGKTIGELTEAIARGIRMFSVESVTDLQHIGTVATWFGVVVDCLLRINSASASASTSIRMTGTPSQFGIDSETLTDVVPQLKAVPGTRIIGAHFFPLSNAKDEQSLIGEFQHTITLAARLQAELGLDFRFLDIGGGFAAPYAVPGQRPAYDKLQLELKNTLDMHFPRWREGTPEFACESGRYLVGDSGHLLTSVVNVKESRGRKFVILDAGINTLGGMSGLGRLLPLSVGINGSNSSDDRTQIAALVGPLCTPGDVLGRNISLPLAEPGDIVTIPNTGAYGITASLLLFLGRPAPTEVVVSGGEVVSVSRIEHNRCYQQCPK